MVRKLRRLRKSGWWAFADDNAGGNADAGKTDSAGSGDKGTAAQTDAGEAKFTQADIDRIVGRETKKAAEKARADIEAEHKKQQMTETEKLQAEKAEAEKKATEAISTANQRLIQSTARVSAIELGIKPERIGAALKLADLSGVTVGDDGEPDAKAITAALEAVLKDLPELKAETKADNASGGSDFSNTNQHQSGDKPLTDALIADMDSQELARRMPEIEAYYAKKRKK